MMNIGMLIGLGFGYALFDKGGQKLVKKTFEKISKTGEELLKNLNKEGEKNELQGNESEQ